MRGINIVNNRVVVLSGSVADFGYNYNLHSHMKKQIKKRHLLNERLLHLIYFKHFRVLQSAKLFIVSIYHKSYE